MMSVSPGSWHGAARYFGLHYDLHASTTDQDLGSRCGPDELIPSLQRMNPDFVQTDCKGHAGYTSWFSKVPNAAVAPQLQHDALAQWREATRQLGLPLHCHYSGIWDKAAGAKHPEWSVVGPTGEATGAPFGQNAGAPSPEKMCPRGPYLEELMIPQMLELIDRYEVDGFWIDGDLWSVEPCYCERCAAAFTAETGLTPPTELEHADWPAWWNFTRESFEAYVTRYCDAVHAHKPGVLVCSNWLQTFKNPGPPTVPTDWISGDNSWVWGLDGSRCEARYLSTRGKHWDIMLWAFYCSHGMGKPDSPWCPKPAEMIMQEAAAILSTGGHVQVYENPSPLRDGRLIPWRMDILGRVGEFVQARRAVSQGTEAVPQVAVLHSEAHVRATTRGKNLMWSVDVAPVQGAVFAALENHASVEIHDEWSLLPRLADTPCVIAPERNAMSAEMVTALQDYVRQGGALLVTGADAVARFGADFLGLAADGSTETDAKYWAGMGDSMTPIFSAAWHLAQPAPGATGIGVLGDSPLTDDRLLAAPLAVLHPVGQGRVLYCGANLFRDFQHNHYPLTRQLIGTLLRALVQLDLQADAPVCVDIGWRRQADRHVIHLLNRASGIPNSPGNGGIDEIPRVGPITLTIPVERPPEAIDAPCERGDLTWHWHDGTLTITLDRLHIHEAIVIE